MDSIIQFSSAYCKVNSAVPSTIFSLGNNNNKQRQFGAAEQQHHRQQPSYH
jgi:hypothetical protein